MLAARRRLLGMLFTLALVSCALAVTKMAAWWVIVPPAIMLAGYLGLLREAAKADAERGELARAGATEAAARRAAPLAARTGPVTKTGPATRTGPATKTSPAPGAAPAAGAAAAAAPAVPAAAAPPAVPPVPGAEVIDISATLGQGGEEFYDQYADAKLRAVGDLLIPAAA